MMREIKTAKGTWKIYGVYFTPSDSFHDIVKKAIECDNLRQNYLQQVTGYHSPIYIDRASKEIHFLQF